MTLVNEQLKRMNVETYKNLYEQRDAELQRIEALVKPDGYGDIDRVPAGLDFSEEYILETYHALSRHEGYGYVTKQNLTESGVRVRLMIGWKKGKPHKKTGVLTSEQLRRINDDMTKVRDACNASELEKISEFRRIMKVMWKGSHV